MSERLWTLTLKETVFCGCEKQRVMRVQVNVTDEQMTDEKRGRVMLMIQALSMLEEGLDEEINTVCAYCNQSFKTFEAIKVEKQG